MEEHDIEGNENFKWKILKVIKHPGTRKSTEAMFINDSTNLINGCKGWDIPTFLS